MAFIQTLVRRQNLLKQTINIVCRSYATQGLMSLGKKLSKTSEKGEESTVELPVEKDTKKLAAFVCGTNIFRESGENVRIKPDSEYPDWLWTLHTGKPKGLKELDPNTLEYWRKVRNIRIREKLRLSHLYQQNRDHK